MSTIRRKLVGLIQPLVDRLAASVDVIDPWERFEADLRPHQFGPGSRHPFHWYLEGESQVSVTSVTEVADWLYECEYVRDVELFHETDYWQHPKTFEQLRRGDCEDHALWGWRKLRELGVAVSFVSGVLRRGDHEGGHAWVLFETEGASYVLEGTARRREDVVRPLAEVREEYVPHAAVDERLTTWGYWGAAETAATRHRGRQRRRKTRGPG